MTAMLLELALKSLPLAALGLLLPWLLRHRSAAERAALAHAGIAALLALPLLLLTTPHWEVTLLPATTSLATAEPLVPSATSAPQPPAAPPAAAVSALPAAASAPAAALPWLVLAYALPAATLLLLLLAAVLRLAALRAQASTVTDPAWRAALLQAQARIGLRRGIALVATAELATPVSFGLLRPAIVLDADSAARPPVAAAAEALLAHELAHLARRDWAWLLLARLATALFWFNPLAWLLARQCHQLREEAADDAVLRGPVAGTDYAAMLVDAARRQRATLLPAHAMAGRGGALRQRVRRVLDTGLRRAPAARNWSLGCGLGLLALAAPLAALVPASTPGALQRGLASHVTTAVAEDPLTPEADGPLAISFTVSPARRAGQVQLALAYASSGGNSHTSRPVDLAHLEGLATAQLEAPQGAPVRFLLRREAGTLDCGGTAQQGGAAGSCSFSADQAYAETLERRGIGRPSARQQLQLAFQDVPLALVDALQRHGVAAFDVQRLVEAGIHGIAVAWLQDLEQAGQSLPTVQALVEFRIHGVDGAYVRALAAANPALARLQPRELVEMRIHGVSPEGVRELAALGLTGLEQRQLVEMAIHGASPGYVRELAALGYHGLSPKQLVEMRIHGVTPQLIGELAALGYRQLDPEQLVNLRIHGVTPAFIRQRPGGNGQLIPVDELVALRIHGR